MKPIPYGRQNITQEDIEHVVEVLKSDFLTQGPQIGAFEKAFSNFIGSEYSVAVSNGTAALHLSAMALNVQPGDQVIVPVNTFSASANCIRYCGGEVIFADITRDRYTIDLDEVQRILDKDKAGRIKGIVPVDFAGYPVDTELLQQIISDRD
jgi:hypothetical protein